MTSPVSQQLPVRNPRTGEIDYYITPASDQEIKDTCKRLREAQQEWGGATIEHRIGIMKRWAERLQEHCAALVAADSIDTGYGQISKVAPHMVINAVNRTYAFAPAMFEPDER